MKRIYILLWFMCMLLGTVYALNDMPLLAQLQGEHNGSCFGYQVLSLDFNHDGYDDLVVLSAGYGYQYQQTPSRGKVYVYYGGPGFNSTAQPAMTLEGDYPQGMQRKITSIGNIGDVNGDSYDDLVIRDAIPGSTGFYVEGSDRFMLFYGGTDDLSTPDRIELPLPNESFSPYYKLGDVDGDGFDDVGIRYRQSSIYCFDLQWGGSFNRQLVYSGSEILSYSSFIGGIGDINGDGCHDFTIGFVSNETEPPSNIIKAYYGNPDRVFTDPMILINTQSSITRLCKPLNDINGDGQDDFFGYANTDGMMLWYGTDNLDMSHPDVILNPVYFGSESVRGIGTADVNGDGFSDVVGASYDWQRFAVWLGSSIMNGQADWQKTSTIENYGYDLAVGDFNGDGYDDIAVSAPREEDIWPYHDFRGYVYIYAGNIGMVANDDELAPMIIDQWQISTYPNPLVRGRALTIDYKGNGYDRIGEKDITIYNQKGQKVHRQQDNSQGKSWAMQLPELASGVYFISITDGNKTIKTQRIVITK